jgi:hypothetical protein
MRIQQLVTVAFLASLPGLADAQQTILFTFDNAPNQTSLPLDVTSDGLTAHLSATGQGFSIQSANVLGFTPQGFSGLCIYPNSVFAADLLIGFSAPLSSFSIMFSPEEYGSDTSATMRVTAYSGANLIGTNTAIAPNPGTWPTGTLSYDSGSQTFDRVVVHYDKPPVNGENWGPIFLADNMTVTTVPEPAGLAAIGVGLTLLLRRQRRR